ncbi:MAG: HAD hydrolase family protein [Planctomycetota bacterium]
MKFAVLVIDFDGTISDDGSLGAEVRSALQDARSRGIAVILDTGRTLDDLRRLIGDLCIFDAVVGENGAVVSFPGSGRSLSLCPRPPSALLDELARRGVAATHGEGVVEVAADQSVAVLAVIRELELPLAILFNRGRLMILPQAVSKATGLREALRILRLSAHNAIAIGDAENDHEMLLACEVGAAVAWGSPRLQQVADDVVDGTAPPAVASYIRRAISRSRLVPGRGHRKLLLGTTIEGRPLALSVRGRNLLIAGDPRSGKSWVAGLLCEQLILQRYCVCVIDPEGDYAPLEALPGVLVLGGDDRPPGVRDLTRALRYPDVSVIIDLSRMHARDKRQYVSSLLLMLARLRRQTGLPHRIVVDEAHYFLYGEDVHELLDLELGGYTLVTYRASGLHKDLLAAIEAIVVTRATNPAEAQALQAISGGRAAAWHATLRDLAIDEAVLLPRTEEAGGDLCRFAVAARMTPHVRHRHKYLDVPIPVSRAFVFTRDGAPAGRTARTLKEFVDALVASRPEDLAGHLQRSDFSRWIGDVFGDRPLAAQVLELEHDHRHGRVLAINDALADLIQSRYAFA